jgi:hypothetical protein
VRSALVFSLLVLSPVSITWAASPADVAGSGSQLEIRQLQTREYDTLDREMTMRSVVATLQDLGFIIDTADLAIGTVTATRFYQHKRYQTYVMRMTVTVREKDNERIAVRVNARVQEEAVTRPETYQDFFAALDKSMFLTLHKID